MLFLKQVSLNITVVCNTRMSYWSLDERTYCFARDVRAFIKVLPKSIANHEDGRQLIRSSGSIAANYNEANDPLGPKDFLMRMRTSRKEVKETILWLRLLDLGNNDVLKQERKKLINEANELKNILSVIIQKKCI